MVPFHDLGMNTLTIRNTAGTDHLAFNAVGLPVFSLSKTLGLRHAHPITQHGRLRNASRKERHEADAVIVASFVYLTANRDEMLPRSPCRNPSRARPPM